MEEEFERIREELAYRKNISENKELEENPQNRSQFSYSNCSQNQSQYSGGNSRKYTKQATPEHMRDVENDNNTSDKQKKLSKSG